MLPLIVIAPALLRPALQKLFVRHGPTGRHILQAAFDRLEIGTMVCQTLAHGVGGKLARSPLLMLGECGELGQLRFVEIDRQ